MPPRYVISQFATISWRNGELQIMSAATRKTFATTDASLVTTLSSFAVPQTIDEPVPDPIKEWIAAGILVDADMPEPAKLHHWDRESLALHASSRDRKFRKTRGHAMPAIAPRRFEETIPLAPYRAAARGDLAEILDARMSRRTWAKTPINFQTFSDLLWLTARNRTEEKEGRVSRPYPSGGAAYSLELYPVIDHNAIEKIQNGVYRYRPEEHALELISPFDADVRPFLDAAGSTAATAAPPVVIIITSRYARQSEEYGRIAYSLVLKEVGGLFQTFYLVAESLGLAACALGGGTPPGLLARICGTTEIEEPVVGEFAIGRRSA